MNERISNNIARKTVLDPDKKFSNENESPKDWPSARIKYELELMGLTLAAVSRSAGYHPSAAGRALRSEWPELQNHIASALGRDPWEIFPSRYVNCVPRKYLPRSRKRAEQKGDL